MRLCNATAKFIYLLIFSIIILVMPIFVLQVDFLKRFALFLFNNPQNAELYFLFCGSFLGTIVAISGVFIGIEHKKCKERNLQDPCLKVPRR